MKIQAKDINIIPILSFLDALGTLKGEWGTIFTPVDQFKNSVFRAMPENTPEKVGISVMNKLIKQGYVSGCTCGCRGDFEITEKGKEHLSQNRPFRII